MARKYTDEQLRAALPGSRTMAELLRKLGLRGRGANYATVRRRIAELGLDASHLRRSRLVPPSDNVVRNIVRASTSKADVIRRFEWPLAAASYRALNRLIERLDLNIDHFTGQAWRGGKRFGPAPRITAGSVPCRRFSDLVIESARALGSRGIEGGAMRGLLLDRMEWAPYPARSGSHERSLR